MANCDACGREFGILDSKFKLKKNTARICEACMSAVGLPSTSNMGKSAASKLELDQVKSYLAMNNFLRLKMGEASYAIPGLAYFDDETQTALLSRRQFDNRRIDYYNYFAKFDYEQLSECELSIIDGPYLENTVGGGAITRHLISDPTFHNSSQTIGHTQANIIIKITVKDYAEPAYLMNALPGHATKGSAAFHAAYANAQKVVSKIKLITSANKTTTQVNSNKLLENSDPIAEIRKYKELFDEGVLTQEEFEAKKAQILGI